MCLFFLYIHTFYIVLCTYSFYRIVPASFGILFGNFIIIAKFCALSIHLITYLHILYLFPELSCTRYQIPMRWHTSNAQDLDITGEMGELLSIPRGILIWRTDYILWIRKCFKLVYIHLCRYLQTLSYQYSMA